MPLIVNEFLSIYIGIYLGTHESRCFNPAHKDELQDAFFPIDTKNPSEVPFTCVQWA
jgi:hypothetical protein